MADQVAESIIQKLQSDQGDVPKAPLEAELTLKDGYVYSSVALNYLVSLKCKLWEQCEFNNESLGSSNSAFGINLQQIFEEDYPDSGPADHACFPVLLEVQENRNFSKVSVSFCRENNTSIHFQSEAKGKLSKTVTFAPDYAQKRIFMDNPLNDPGGLSRSDGLSEEEQNRFFEQLADTLNHSNLVELSSLPSWQNVEALGEELRTSPQSRRKNDFIRQNNIHYRVYGTISKQRVDR